MAILRTPWAKVAAPQAVQRFWSVRGWRACGIAAVALAAVLIGRPVAAQEVQPQSSADRPNIVWIVSEDNGPFMGCYGDAFANTPNIDGLARHGVLYRNAFAAAPVCAPNRSTIITGCYASGLGTQHMRSTNRIPESIRLFPEYLRKAGYYCSNNSKTDYNLTPVPRDAWHEIRNGHYRNRKPGQPFFAVFNLTTTHESSLHNSKVEDRFLASKLSLPPYHPDLPEIRSNWVQYYEIISRMDAQVGEILAQLEKDGLAEDTIVFYYSDHGGILTRSKRFLYDTGVHIPLVIRFPKKYQHLAPGEPGSQTDRLVSCVDLAPTILSLCGVPIPEYMQGQAFLGSQQAQPREYVYCFRGRMDERYDMMRAVRDKRFKYIRNYMPHRIYGQHLNYLWRMPTTQSWEAAFLSGKTNDVQSIFWQTKPAEELYDTQADPWEVNNLADDPNYHDVLQRMRAANREHLLAIRDSGFLPEAEMMDRASKDTIYQMVRDRQRYPLEKLIDAAELAAGRDAADVTKLIELMKAEDAGLRYWGAVGCAVREDDAKEALQPLKKRLLDASASVRIAAAEAVARLGQPQLALPVLVTALKQENPRAVLHAVNVLQVLDDVASPVANDVRSITQNHSDDYVQRAAEWFLETRRED